MNEHIATRRGWTVVLRRSTGGDFVAYGDGEESNLGRIFVKTRARARARLKELGEHGMHGYISRATVTLRRHR